MKISSRDFQTWNDSSFHADQNHSLSLNAATIFWQVFLKLAPTESVHDGFEGKGNVADSVAKEAMLFLACETNFSSAVRKVGAASQDDFVVVAEGKIPSAKLKKALKLIRCEQLSLTEWGKKKGNYFEGEIAVEKMALSRIRN